MYSLDINFLKDRPEYQSPESAPKAARRKVPVGEKVPLYIGVGIGLALPALAGALLLFVQQQTAEIVKQQADKDRELASIQGKIQQVKQIEDRISEVKTQTNSVIGIFSQIRPWSAVLQDIRDRTPPNLQISGIQEALLPATAQPASPSPSGSPSPSPSPNSSPQAGASPTPKPTPTLPPPPSTGITITGTARSFDEVNLFVLSLRQSSFFLSDETRLQSAQLTTNPTQIEQIRTPGQEGTPIVYELPEIVTYTIQTRLNNAPAQDLLEELERKGAVGLATRIRTIQRIQAQGATQ
jgi:type IV pilus assembly protein PilN